MSTKKKEEVKGTPEKVKAHVRELNSQIAQLWLIGRSPLVINKFSHKAKLQMMSDMSSPKTARKKDKSPRNFEQDCRDARHLSEEGWDGVHASAFRCAAIRASKAAGIEMSLTKLCFSVVADGFDAESAEPLVKIIGPEPEMNVAPVRLQGDKTSLAARPMWRHWGMCLNIEYDADQFSFDDVCNLVYRIGRQVGIGEGRPYAHRSDGGGMGWGLFDLSTKEEVMKLVSTTKKGKTK